MNDTKAAEWQQQSAAAQGERREIVLHTPITEEQIRELNVGDVVILNGPMYTGRDALHKYLMDHDSPVDLKARRFTIAVRLC